MQTDQVKQPYNALLRVAINIHGNLGLILDDKTLALISLCKAWTCHSENLSCLGHKVFAFWTEQRVAFGYRQYD